MGSHSEMDFGYLKHQSLKTAKELGYGHETIERIRKATTRGEVFRALNNARIQKCDTYDKKRSYIRSGDTEELRGQIEAFLDRFDKYDIEHGLNLQIKTSKKDGVKGVLKEYGYSV